MSERFDLVVIGTGTAAMVAAMRMRNAGKTVAVIDHRPFGGTCALRGCDPKKMLIGGASALDHAKRMHGKGVEGEIGISWADLMAFKRNFTDPVPSKHEQRYADKAIAAFHGHASFEGPDTLRVGENVVSGENILIAAGAEPASLGFAGEDLLADNEAFLDLPELPKRIVFVGGGYIAAEFAHIAVRAGAAVTIVQRGNRLLKNFDADVVGYLMGAFHKQQIDVRLQTTVEGVERNGSEFRVRVRSGGDAATVIPADLVVHAAGRVPALSGLDLDKAGVVLSDSGHIKLNEFLQSVSNPRIYAAGDVAQSGPPLTPVSSHDAKVVVANLLHGNHARPDYRGVPSVAFTIPPIAMAGLTEEQARTKGLRFSVKSDEVPTWFTARQAAEQTYGFKVLVEEGTGKVLGAHLVGPHADEVINIFAVAIRHGLTADDLKQTMFAYPSGASDIGYML
jgi:glutathione reductase (NADPH)